MPWAIIADLPLGTYRGAGADGRPERIPSMTRLHSALLCAAGFGPRAIERDHESLDIHEADAVALRWLESNPPDSVRIPALEVNAGRAVAYRNDGTLRKDSKGGTYSIKKLPKAPDAGTAVDGRFVWIWREAPPDPVRASLEQLCPDVGYLGTTESPVRLSAVTDDAFEATHDLDPEAGLFSAAALGCDVPAPGRMEELSAAHRAATGPPPRKDDHGGNEGSLSPVPPRQRVATAWYSPRRAPTLEVPWPQVITVPMDTVISERDRVAWAVAVHRALIRLIGFGAPPMITGAYPDGVSRPANRIALHLLGPEMPLPDPGPGLAILVPVGADPADLDVLRRAVESMTSLRGPQGKLVRLATGKIRVVDGGRFWAPPPLGSARLWRTVPAAIPDTRGSRDAEWNFAHAALLSLGFVWKDLLPRISGRGPAYYRGLAAAVSEAGASVLHVRAIRASDVGRYVHKVNEHAVVRPYSACLSLGRLAGPGAIQAIGQSRHLGGGLLIPFDVPEGTRAGDVIMPNGGGA
jgi:CRISPR-associated protein Csb2